MTLDPAQTEGMDAAGSNAAESPQPALVPSFRILGPLEVRDGSGPLELGGLKQRAVLVALLLSANRVVALDRLVDELWGEDPPAQATNALQTYVSKLRSVLEPDRRPREPARVLRSQPPGYMLVVNPADFDATLFEELASEGRALLRHGRPQEARERFVAALALWRGSPLAEFPEQRFAREEAARLEELHAGRTRRADRGRAAARRARGADRRAAAGGRARAAARAAVGAADARALPRRPAGRRARRVPPLSRDPRRRARRRARARAAAAAGGDPRAGPDLESTAGAADAPAAAAVGRVPSPATSTPRAATNGRPRNRRAPVRRRGRGVESACAADGADRSRAGARGDLRARSPRRLRGRHADRARRRREDAAGARGGRRAARRGARRAFRRAGGAVGSRARDADDRQHARRRPRPADAGELARPQGDAADPRQHGAGARGRARARRAARAGAAAEAAGHQPRAAAVARGTHVSRATARRARSGRAHGRRRCATPRGGRAVRRACRRDRTELRR